MTEFIEVQHILGRRVRDTAGRVAGRIESIPAETIGPRCVIHEYCLGTAALLSRLGMSTAKLFGFRARPKLLRVPWQQMDLSDPENPRLRCTCGELEALQAKLPPFEDKSPPKRPTGKD